VEPYRTGLEGDTLKNASFLMVYQGGPKHEAKHLTQEDKYETMTKIQITND